jgi:hypothetical protein
MTYIKLDPIEPHYVGCLCCAGAGTELPMGTVLYSGFGGWRIEKNGEVFFEDESNKGWEDFKKLSEIEDVASKEPDEDWRAICDTPLHGETYQRQEGKWVLVEQNEGFA